MQNSCSHFLYVVVPQENSQELPCDASHGVVLDCGRCKLYLYGVNVLSCTECIVWVMHASSPVGGPGPLPCQSEHPVNDASNVIKAAVVNLCE